MDIVPQSYRRSDTGGVRGPLIRARPNARKIPGNLVAHLGDKFVTLAGDATRDVAAIFA